MMQKTILIYIDILILMGLKKIQVGNTMFDVILTSQFKKGREEISE